MEAVIGLTVATVVLLAITLMAARQVRHLRSLPRITPNQAGFGPPGEVLLHGITHPGDGEVPAPITGVPCLFARAYETQRSTRYDQEGNPHTSERTRELSRVDTRFTVVDASPPYGWVLVDSRQLTSSDLTPQSIPAVGGRQFGRIRIGGDSSLSEERLQRGHPVWLIGHLGPLPTGGFALTGRIALASREPSSSSTGVKIFGALTALGLVATLVALVLAVA